MEEVIRAAAPQPRLSAPEDGNGQRHAPRGVTPVSSMRTFWGLMRAYWFSHRWKEAWLLALVIALLTAGASKTGVWIAMASGDLVNSIAFFHNPLNLSPLRALLHSAGWLVMLVMLKEIAFTGVRHLFSTTLHRKWRRWLDEQFNGALLDANHTHYHVQRDGRDDDGEARSAPDNIDQRMQESIKSMTGGAIGLAMGVIGVATSLFFVGQKLIETSTVIEGLGFLGIYGSAVLSLAAVAVYVPTSTWVALKLGRMLENLNMAMQQNEGSYRAELTMLLRRSFHVAASGAEGVHRTLHADLYRGIDRVWGRLNIVNSAYMSFQLIYDFVASRIISYGPGLLPYVKDQISLKDYVTGAELVNSLISQCSWFIHVMPAIATLKANARRVTELANAIERVSAPAEFYRQTGRSEFDYGSQHAVFGLTVRHIELLHGDDPAPFLTADNLRFRRGEWSFLKGPSGCGKTSFLKAVNGLWPYGGGEIVYPEGVSALYAAQEVKLPGVTLKQLVCIPDHDGGHTDVTVAAALHKAGLGEFIEHLDAGLVEGRPWDEVLSGGQKQKLVLARILLHRPGLLFLDEATGALDPAAKVAFHQAIRDACPDIIVISVMHETEPPRSATGEPFYHSVVHFEDGVAYKRAYGADKPAPVPAAVPAAASVPAIAGLRLARRLLARID